MAAALKFGGQKGIDQLHGQALPHHTLPEGENIGVIVGTRHAGAEGIGAAALFFIEGSKKPVPIEGAKTITVTVMQEGVENKVFTIHTDAEFLRGALEQEKLVEGTESQYGLYVTTVDGVTADDSQRQYWCFKDGNGNDLTVGVDSAPIADGDAFQIVLTTY